jgi:hypothetical protein
MKELMANDDEPESSGGCLPDEQLSTICCASKIWTVYETENKGMEPTVFS